MMSASSVKIIKEQEIKDLIFPQEDVLFETEDREIRFNKLLKVVSLERLERVKIFFADDSGLKKIEAKISSITEKSVILTKSAVIPLQRIISVA